MNDATTAARRPRRWPWILAGLCLAGVVIAPLAAYAFGAVVMGPYEGDGGLGGFLAAVYGDALRGRWSALGLVLSPAAAVLCWWAVIAWLRSARRPSAQE